MHNLKGCSWNVDSAVSEAPHFFLETGMATTKYTAALIGTGRIGFTLGFDKKREQPASHTMALLSNKRIQIVAGCDSDAENLSRWHKFVPKAAVFSDCKEMLSSVSADIVVVAVNEDAHKSCAIAAIKSKPKLVILEKPVALNSIEGNEIKAAAEEAGVPVLINHERRFADDYRIAKKYISEIGSLQTVNARLDSGFYVYNPEKESNGEYSLLHDGTHLVDIVMYLLEDEEIPLEPVLENLEITDVFYDAKMSGVVRNLNVHAQNKKCSDINLFFSGRSRYFGFEVEFIGTEGRFKIGNGIFEFYSRQESKLYTGFYSLLPDKKIKKPSKTGYFANMVQNGVDFLEGKAALRSTLQTGLNTLSVLEEIKNHL